MKKAVYCKVVSCGNPEQRSEAGWAGDCLIRRRQQSAAGVTKKTVTNEERGVAAAAANGPEPGEE